MSHHRNFVRNYSREEFLGEVSNILRDDNYKDFMFVGLGGDGTRSIRIGSEDRDLRIGDLLYLNEIIKEDIMRL